MVVSAILGSPGRTGCFPGRLAIQDFPFARKKAKGRRWVGADKTAATVEPS